MTKKTASTTRAATRTSRSQAGSSARRRARTPARARAQSTAQAASDEFMKMLRDDHAGMSRVLREIDAQQTALQSMPETARPVLVEAMRYILVYQHSVHHPREDVLFAKIRDREPALYRNMRRLVMEHRIGQERAEALARDLARATPAQLRGKAGLRIAKQLQDYVRHTRSHMRREEAVFYAGAARVLRASDWARIASGPMPRDPAGNLTRLADRYPRLAARLAQPERMVTGHGERLAQPQDRPGMRQRAEAVAELCGEVLHETVDFVRAGLADLGAVRSPAGAVQASLSIGARSVRCAARLAVLPFSR
jgi:hemerythrin-like domain-containing protein